MHIAYKLVDQCGFTRRGVYGETLWLPVGTVVRPTGAGYGPCGPGVLHAYSRPDVAVLANPIHAKIDQPRLLEIDSDQAWETDGLKLWTHGTCTVIGESPLPTFSTEELVAWAILLSPHSVTRAWAVGWLSGQNRSASEAWAAVQAAWAALAVAWEARADEEAQAARAAAQAADAALALAEAEAAEQAAVAWVARAAAQAAAVAAQSAGGTIAFARRLPLALERARQVLAGEIPAEQAWDFIAGVAHE